MKNELLILHLEATFWGSHCKHQALVYDILPSTAAVFSYAIGSRKLSANEQFFCWCSSVVRLLQTTQIISDICFIADHVAYASSNKAKIVWLETELFFFLFYPGWMRLMFACVLGQLLLQSYWYPNLSEGADHVGGQLRGAKSAPSVAWLNLVEFGGRCRKAMLGVCSRGSTCQQTHSSLSGTVLETLSLSEGALFIYAQLSSDAVSALRKVLSLIHISEPTRPP